MSLITTAINLIGTVSSVLYSPAAVSPAVLSTYSIATVGDGLVSQIPALLIFTATGMIVAKELFQKAA